jgi:hypothetical protein
MSVADKNIKDKTKIVLNPITGELDIVLKFNENRIVTHKRNAAGALNMIFDPASGTHIEMGDQVVVDDNGNVVVVGA